MNSYVHMRKGALRAAVFLDDAERQLVWALVATHATNVRSHIAALEHMPDLAEVADEGWSDLGSQLETAQAVLRKLET